MTKFSVIYEQFLATVSINFGELTNKEILKELEKWVIMASSSFKYPRISLEFVESEGEEEAYFLNELTQKEINVILEHLKVLALNIQLMDEKRYDLYYEDANLKLPSQSAMITQINRSLENQIAKAKEVENDYYRTLDNKPTIGNIWTS